jgi:hypothetical protein
MTGNLKRLISNSIYENTTTITGVFTNGYILLKLNVNQPFKVLVL